MSRRVFRIDRDHLESGHLDDAPSDITEPSLEFTLAEQQPTDSRGSQSRAACRRARLYTSALRIAAPATRAIACANPIAGGRTRLCAATNMIMPPPAEGSETLINHVPAANASRNRAGRMSDARTSSAYSGSGTKRLCRAASARVNGAKPSASRNLDASAASWAW